MKISIVIFDLDQTLVDTSCALIDRKRRNWPVVYRKIPQMKVYDGIYNVLDYLKQNGIPYCVVTSSPETYCKKVLTHFGICPKITIAYHDVSKHKPDPEALLLVMEKSGILNPIEVLHIGDDAKDVLASKAAGTRIVGVAWGSSDNSDLIRSYPEYIVNNPLDIIKLLEDNN